MIESVRPPGRWSGEQGRFRRGAPESLEGVDRGQVAFRWWMSEAYHDVPGLIATLVNIVQHFVRKRRREGQVSHPGGCHIAIFTGDARVGDDPVLVFQVDDGTFLPPEGQGTGQIIGELAPNGTLLLRTDDGLDVWPIGHPRVPYPGSPQLKSR